MIRNNLPGYIREHLKKDLFAYVIREDDTIVSCAFLLIVMKPMSPAFINGKTATVLNVYTLPAYRRRGYARILMNAIIADAKELNIAPEILLQYKMILYQCDVASYTKDAGGFKYLEHLFEYENGEKVFDEEEGLISMSPEFKERYITLKSCIV
jgi:GNAT superfamily N-acetyltransferase